MNIFRNTPSSLFGHIDIILLTSALLISAAGLVTMYGYLGSNEFFYKQIVWLSIALIFSIGVSFVDFRFFRRTSVVVFLFIATAVLLGSVFVFGDIVKGAQSRFSFGGVAIQPAEYAKLVVIILLAKYFSRRHIEIAQIRHVIVSGLYAFVIFLLIAKQPDFGSAIMIFFIWLGIVLVSGISKKHLALVAILSTLAVAGMWAFVFADYQKARIMNFIHPLADIRGTGYNAYQSTIAVGSGEVLGKGIGYGTQSKLQFLPEYQTDFIFASFAEEWGFVGVLFLMALFLVLFWRLLVHAHFGASNFETLFILGVVILFVSQFMIHVGMNIGILPVTGVTIPFMSYGGSHLLMEFIALGMVMSMRRYSRVVHKENAWFEFIGV